MVDFVMMDFTRLILVAILVEAIWENIKMIYDKDKLNPNMIGSLLVGMIICIAARIDIFDIVGIKLFFPIIGYVFTGIIVSRGANFVSDLFKRLKKE